MSDWLLRKKKVSNEAPKPSLFNQHAAPMWRQGDVFVRSIIASSSQS